MVNRVGRPVEEIMAEIEQEKLEKAQKVELKSQKLFVNDKVLLGDAEKSFSRMVGLPLAFVKGCDDDDLSNRILSHCSTNLEAIKVVETGDVVTRVFPDSYQYVSRRRFLEMFVKKEPKAEVESYDKSRISLVTERAAHPPKKIDDISYGGLTFELAYPSYRVEGFIYRLACLNGMLSPHMYSTMVDSKINLEPELMNMADNCLKFVEGNFMPKFMELDETKVDNPTQLVHRIAQRYGLPAGVVKTIADKVPSLEAPVSYYDVVNLITSIGRDKITEGMGKTGRSLQRFGGYMTHVSNKHYCSTCGCDLDKEQK